MGQFLPPDHSKGDANTVGGYTAVHARPPGFEGKDGASYTAEIVTDEVGGGKYGAYLIFVNWGYSSENAIGHLETGYLIYASTEEEARTKLGAISLNDAKSHLDRLIGITGAR